MSLPDYLRRLLSLPGRVTDAYRRTGQATRPLERVYTAAHTDKREAVRRFGRRAGDR